MKKSNRIIFGVCYLFFLIQEKLFSLLIKMNAGNCIQTMYKQDHIIPAQELNAQFKSNIASDKPFAYGRPGSSEISPLVWYSQFKKYTSAYPKKTKNILWNNAGIFPNTDEQAQVFVDEIILSLNELDYLGVYGFVQNERNILLKYAEKIKFCDNAIANAFFLEQPWTLALKEKKVLVISPFAETIKKQYNTNREQLFSHPVLPEFDLKTIKMVQAQAFNTPKGYSNWRDVCDDIYKQILDIDFDVALISAGGYSLPLVKFIKKRCNKTAIQMGGALQILFGVKGARWDDNRAGIELYNKYWVRPSKDERITNLNQVEQGCYW